MFPPFTCILKKYKLIAILSCTLCLTLYMNFNKKDEYSTAIYLIPEQSSHLTFLNKPMRHPDPASEYVVYSNNCKIPYIDPFNDEIKKYVHKYENLVCRKLELLSYITITNNKATLHINQTLVPLYSSTGVTCCYADASCYRGRDATNGFKWQRCQCEHFRRKVNIKHDLALVKCQVVGTNLTIYKNVHVIITVKPKVKAKIKKSGQRGKLNVLMIAVNSLSRLNFIRNMPKTYTYMRQNDWIEMFGYNKIEDDTLPNMMAILTGLNITQALKKCSANIERESSKCRFIWKDFNKFNYVTSYGQDSYTLDTFAQFVNTPTDYYYRTPVTTLANFLNNTVINEETNYCIGPESYGERLLNFAKDFAWTFKSHPYFGFFWFKVWSHDNPNRASSIDELFLNFFTSIEEALKDTMVVFFSDHGFKYGKMRLTKTGTYEDRLPVLHFSLPKWFHDEYPLQIRNLKENSERLITPYDLHMTLQDILTFTNQRYRTRRSQGCPTCHSLLKKIDPERSCSDARIAYSWCSCLHFDYFDPQDNLAIAAGNFIIEAIHEIHRNINGGDQCSRYVMKKVLECGFTTIPGTESTTVLQVKVLTVPYSVYEATVSYVFADGKPKFLLDGTISRLNYYANDTACLSFKPNLEKYCYCKSRMSIFDWLWPFKF